ncbi:precorrin-6A/cobalt-precorrin-6A reductase [Secundilactobacillus collinoides]|uniref:precorrin-6A/cobalt-precorrin-6A reductase n=1 Tax=Secundilactobacillus collinoides TaxID=33960 RepID=UPI000A8C6E67|nr:precorrin-6A/cobalt-precorrin-6A reductase [Secundilactobacillus collinoides]
MILLLGGTSESLDVADYLTKAKAPFILSVTTDYGAELARPHAVHVSEQILTPATFHDFFHRASHYTDHRCHASVC